MERAPSPPDWYQEDVVCVAIVPIGQTVDWSPDSYEPELSLWPPEGTFLRFQSIARELDLEPLATLNPYEQSRHSKDVCKALLSRWDELAVAVENTPGAGWVAAIGLLLKCCARSDGVELLIEGP